MVLEGSGDFAISHGIFDDIPNLSVSIACLLAIPCSLPYAVCHSNRFSAYDRSHDDLADGRIKRWGGSHSLMTAEILHRETLRVRPNQRCRRVSDENRHRYSIC